MRARGGGRCLTLCSTLHVFFGVFKRLTVREMLRYRYAYNAETEWNGTTPLEWDHAHDLYQAMIHATSNT